VSQQHLSHEQQSKYLLRALGALRLLRSKQRIVPDEAAYRALIVACGRTRTDRRMELVKLFGLLRSDGILPSAVTLGQYTRALAEGYSKQSTGPLEDDGGGSVEVTESASLDLRIRRGKGNLEILLGILDGSLAVLEDAGRRWRQKSNAGNEDVNTTEDPSVSHGVKSSHSDRRKKRSSRPWLPVQLSSSFVSTGQEESVPLHSLPLSRSNLRLQTIWSRTKSCDCKYTRMIVPLLSSFSNSSLSMRVYPTRGGDTGRLGRPLGRTRYPWSDQLSEMWHSYDPNVGLQSVFLKRGVGVG
jgi:hypothetical protein